MSATYYLILTAYGAQRIAQQSATLAYGEVSETIDISTDNLAVPFNCFISASGFEGAAVMPLSIKVQSLAEG